MGSYILDFACCSARVVVEVDAGQGHRSNAIYPVTYLPELRVVFGAAFLDIHTDRNDETVLENILQELNRRSPSP